MTSQRPISEFFQRTPTTSGNRHQHTPERTNITPQATFQPQVASTLVSLPQPILKTINSLGTKYAGIFCASLNISETINNLKKHKTDGTIPHQMEFKFKKLFTNENETNLRSTMINAAIDLELTRLNSKSMELNTSYDNRIHELEELISSPLILCGYTIDSSHIISSFEQTLQQRKLEFILKQNKDKVKKQIKKQAFQARRESNNEIATLSNRQVNKLNKEIKDLKDNLKKIKIQNKPKVKPNENRSKNVKGGQIKSTGEKKKNVGRKKFVTRNN